MPLMPNEHDFYSAVSTMQACRKTLEALWDRVDQDWSGMSSFSGPKRDELDLELSEHGASKVTAISQLDVAIDVARQRAQGCATYRRQMLSFAAGTGPEPHRPWYCDEIYVHPY